VQTPICKQLGIEYPIFAFSHCRDVVIEVSRAGGLGVLGSTRYTPAELEIELSHIDAAVQGRPYGIDMLFPLSSSGDDEAELTARIPQEHREFMAKLDARLHIPPPKPRDQGFRIGDNLVNTHRRAREALEVALRHPVRLMASALGPVPADILPRLKAHNIMIAGLVGRPAHARLHVDGGADIIVAVGGEAGGHVGDISTMVLVPQIVDAVAPLPVLAAGGIMSGRQIAAAMALGAQGVWTGSIWLTTAESEVIPILKEKLLKARSQDTVRSKCLTGRPIRQLRTEWVDAWEAPDAPPFLPSPLQGLLVRDSIASMHEHTLKNVIGYPVGQGVGMMTESLTVRQVIYGLLEEFALSAERVGAMVAETDA